MRTIFYSLLFILMSSQFVMASGVTPDFDNIKSGGMIANVASIFMAESMIIDIYFYLITIVSAFLYKNLVAIVLLGFFLKYLIYGTKESINGNISIWGKYLWFY